MTTQTLVNVLILTPPGDTLEVNIPNELEAFQREVDGYIKPISLGTDAVLFVNEDACQWPLQSGGLGELPYNARATLLARTMEAIDKDDYLCGVVLLFGANGGPEVLDCPADLKLAARALMP